MKKALIYSVAVMVTLASIASCGGGSKKAEAEAAAQEAALLKEQAIKDSIAAVERVKREMEAVDKMKTLPEEPVFAIETNLGTIKVKLYSKTPKHRDNFAKLALSGYYD
ncbi:MAG: peptidylprolyl isomerase, partial [Bacteroidales bacterium]|nr:peptidylprolyl isomerase [Bacteroidales bacterium]